jgi:hypothetical protein
MATFANNSMINVPVKGLIARMPPSPKLVMTATAAMTRLRRSKNNTKKFGTGYHVDDRFVILDR